MELSSTQAKSLHKALLSAFPNHSTLAQMVRFELGVNLAMIADGNGQSDRIFRLIEWAETVGRVHDLTRGAAHSNSGNHSLKEWISVNVHQSNPEKSESNQTHVTNQNSNSGSDDHSPLDSRTQELISILKFRADNIKEQLSQYYNYAPVKDYISKFERLHISHIEALEKRNLVLAHEILASIHEVSSVLEGNEFWARHCAERPHMSYRLNVDAFSRGRIICEYIVGEMTNYSELYPTGLSDEFNGLGIEGADKIYNRIYDSNK